MAVACGWIFRSPIRNKLRVVRERSRRPLSASKAAHLIYKAPTGNRVPKLVGAMDVIIVVILLLVLVVALYLFVIQLALAVMIVIAFWPAIVGIGAGIFLWRTGHDNLGAVSGLIGVLGTVLWMLCWGGKSGGYSGYDNSESMKDILRDIRDKLDRR